MGAAWEEMEEMEGKWLIITKSDVMKTESPEWAAILPEIRRLARQVVEGDARRQIERTDMLVLMTACMAHQVLTVLDRIAQVFDVEKEALLRTLADDLQVWVQRFYWMYLYTYGQTTTSEDEFAATLGICTAPEFRTGVTTLAAWIANAAGLQATGGDLVIGAGIDEAVTGLRPLEGCTTEFLKIVKKELGGDKK